MLCPKCGSECESGSKFCLSCGAKLDDEGVKKAGISENLYSQDYKGGDPSPLGGGDVPSAAKTGSKKFLIITLVVLIVVALGIGCFFLVRNNLKKNSIVESPTKYVFSSYQSYFDEMNEGSEFYNILKESAEHGSLKLSAGVDLSSMGVTQPVGMDMLYSYDLKDNKCYFKIDAGKIAPLLIMTSGGQGSSNIFAELYSNIDRTDINFDVLGKQGKYYIDLGKFREQITNSIFSPDKENVLGVSKEDFEKFIDAVESFYQTAKQNKDASSSEAEKKFDEFVKKLESIGEVKVEDGETEVGSEKVKADVITYTYDAGALKKILQYVKEETVSYLENNKSVLGDDAQKTIDEFKTNFDKAINEFDSKVDKNVKVVFKNYVSKDKKPAKMELVLENVFPSTEQSDNSHFVISADFTRKSSGAAIILKATNGDEELTASFVKVVDGNKTSFIIEGSDNKSDKNISARLDYNKDDKVFTISAGEFSFSGTAEVKDGSIIIGFNPDLSKYNVPGKVDVKLEISSKPQMNEINAEKSLLSITMEDLENLVGSIPAGGNDDGYDYGGADGSDMSDASTVDNALKVYYAGVVAGTINNEEKLPDGTPLSNLPAKNATVSERKAAANSATVEDALKYNGLDEYITDGLLIRMVVSKDGNVSLWNGEDFSEFKDITLTKSTTLGEIFG